MRHFQAKTTSALQRPNTVEIAWRDLTDIIKDVKETIQVLGDIKSLKTWCTQRSKWK